MFESLAFILEYGCRDSKEQQKQEQAEHMAGNFLFGEKAEVGVKNFAENGPKRSGK